MIGHLEPFCEYLWHPVTSRFWGSPAQNPSYVILFLFPNPSRPKMFLSHVLLSSQGSIFLSHYFNTFLNSFIITTLLLLNRPLMKNVLSREPAILTRVPNKGVVKFQHEHFNVENTYFYNTLRLNQWMMLSHIMITLSECCYRNNEKKTLCYRTLIS